MGEVFSKLDYLAKLSARWFLCFGCVNFFTCRHPLCPCHPILLHFRCNFCATLIFFINKHILFWRIAAWRSLFNLFLGMFWAEFLDKGLGFEGDLVALFFEVELGFLETELWYLLIRPIILFQSSFIRKRFLTRATIFRFWLKSLYFLDFYVWIIVIFV